MWVRLRERAAALTTPSRKPATASPFHHYRRDVPTQGTTNTDCGKIIMRHPISIASGPHIKAARALSGLRQAELAGFAGHHVNSIKRLERARVISGGDYAAGKVCG